MEKENAIVFDVTAPGIDGLDIKEMRFTEKDNKLTANLYFGEFFKLEIWEEQGILKGALLDSSLGDILLVISKL